ncbi:MAG: hypothetical protein R3F03_07990 [Opitutaceae bacterium]
MDRTPVRNRIFPRFRIVWSRITEPKARWVGGILGFRILSGARDLMVLIAVRGVLVWTVTLAVTAFVIGTAAGAWLLSRNPYNRIGYLDLVLPTRWHELRSKRGLALIDEGIHEVKQRRYAAGIMLLAHGLRFEPSNLSGRIIMGQMFAGGGQLHRAMQYFRGGLPYADGQQRYLEMTFRLADYLEDDQLQLKMLDEALQVQAPEQKAVRKWLRDRKAAVLARMGRYQDVVELWTNARDDRSMNLNAAYVRALAGLGRGDEAIGLIEANPDAYGVFGEPWRLLLDIARATQRTDVGRRAAQAMVRADHNDFGNYAERVAYLYEVGTAAEVTAAVDDFFNRFGIKEDARLTLLKRLETVTPASGPSLDLVWNRVAELGTPSVQAQMAHVQNLLVNGRLEDARPAYATVRQQIEATASKEKGWAEGTGYVLDLLLTRSPSAFSQLQGFCETRPLPPDAYRFLVRALVANDAPEQADGIAAMARNRFPSIRDLPEIVLPEIKSPVDTEVIVASKAPTTNPEARQALEEMNRALENAAWAAALEQIVIVEQSPLARELNEQLLYARIRIHGHLSNQTELSWYLRQLMKLPRGFAPARLREQAEELHAAGRTDSALTLLREILRAHPEAKWAGDLQEKWREQLQGAPTDLSSSAK